MADADPQLTSGTSARGQSGELLRDALRQYERVDGAVREPLSTASRVTSDPEGEPIEIDSHDAHHLEGIFGGGLDWYFAVLANTEIETEKKALKAELERLTTTLLCAGGT
ncbi:MULTISPECIES: hypothetical protein [unclassified Methylobacterium]|uniref:hypothetical protein n=1 Tax=unclassified Methylobacterium TaxID=2615210 RepID=UPI0011C1F727|nr:MULTISPECIES: hypothetical protein [unclassified Methylobacterium]MCJ2140398.1 hypothetical protein [Methylobacterium sp. E-066]QEE38797.1 hypothetical protein FVA80_07285 [Methylobacterium sp. WL1]TXN57421.1 hypothetical protein FV241_11475 [Methylobacterium sp. WL2]